MLDVVLAPFGLSFRQDYPPLPPGPHIAPSVSTRRSHVVLNHHAYQ